MAVARLMETTGLVFGDAREVAMEYVVCAECAKSSQAATCSPGGVRSAHCGLTRLFDDLHRFISRPMNGLLEQFAACMAAQLVLCSTHVSLNRTPV